MKHLLVHCCDAALLYNATTESNDQFVFCFHSKGIAKTHVMPNIACLLLPAC